MHYYEENKPFFDHPYMIMDSDKEDPHRFFKAVFTPHPLHSLRSTLANLKHIAFTTDNDYITESDERRTLSSELICIEELLEMCVYIMEKALLVRKQLAKEEDV